jgi:hypothetical protein
MEGVVKFAVAKFEAPRPPKRPIGSSALSRRPRSLRWVCNSDLRYRFQFQQTNFIYFHFFTCRSRISLFAQ